jgi:hypothetical protein
MIFDIFVHAPGLISERNGIFFCLPHRRSLPFRILLKRMHRLVPRESVASADKEINRMMQELGALAKVFSRAEKLCLLRPVKKAPEGGTR